MKYYFFSTAIIVLSATTLYSAGPESAFVPRQKKFIRDLFEGRRYFEAIAETRRLLYEEKIPENNRDYNYFISINYFLGGQYKSVVHGITAGPHAADYRNRILVSQSYLKMGAFPLSLDTLRDTDYASVEPSSRFPLLLRKVEAYLYCKKYQDLLGEIQEARRFIADDGKVSLLHTSVSRFRELPFRSVPAAVVMSALIPGSGQMYAGRYAYGVLSFIGVLATAGGAWYCYKRNKELSFALMFCSGIFYVGNIYGAYSASTSANEDLHRAFREEVNKQFIPPYDAAAEVRDNRVFR